jgi:uncharacterized protein
MHTTVGLLTIDLHLPGNDSLKGKRGILKPVLAHLRQEFNISVAEVGEQDSWQKATLAAACVSSDAEYVHGLLTRVAQAVQNWRLDAEVVDYDIELL